VLIVNWHKGYHYAILSPLGSLFVRDNIIYILDDPWKPRLCAQIEAIIAYCEKQKDIKNLKIIRTKAWAKDDMNVALNKILATFASEDLIQKHINTTQKAFLQQIIWRIMQKANSISPKYIPEHLKTFENLTITELYRRYIQQKKALCLSLTIHPCTTPHINLFNMISTLYPIKSLICTEENQWLPQWTKALEFKRKRILRYFYINYSDELYSAFLTTDGSFYVMFDDNKYKKLPIEGEVKEIYGSNTYLAYSTKNDTLYYYHGVYSDDDCGYNIILDNMINNRFIKFTRITIPDAYTTKTQ
ncbi:unnamed protein product, partial [marine sediment metagenome]